MHKCTYCDLPAIGRNRLDEYACPKHMDVKLCHEIVLQGWMNTYREVRNDRARLQRACDAWKSMSIWEFIKEKFINYLLKKGIINV